ncbi:uncharacterized protein [Onthophagus taurus]|uniref:uncharacterized protein n=1 Tax=Onthophagus taurus TaxID=166361 RepID=UPI000C203CC5|nr:uncharacterized protein LOC111425203 [Onthophagus taurus]
MAEHNSTTAFDTPLFREIHKNSWLTKVPTENTKKKKEKVWVVFCVHDDNEAYLETYFDSKMAATHKPDWYVSLQHTSHVSPTICPQEQEYEFVITLYNEVVRLAAPTSEQMLDWVESLRAKLQELRILSPKENIYSKMPENKAANLLPTRDPTSPLPPPPAVPPVMLPGVEPFELSLHRSGSNEEQQSSVFNFEDLHSTLTSRSSYDRLFVERPGPSTRSFSSPSHLQPPPQPSSYRTLREQQVLQLQKEMKHPSGVRLQLRRKDCISSIALVDIFNGVWICGWKQKEHPMLYNALHIGDQLLFVENIPVKNSTEANKILRHSCCGLYVNVVVKRVPHGKVFIIHRDTEGQALGIVQEGNTAVIRSVQVDSLAARHGLSGRTQTCDGLSFTNWVLTEINGRPLNLFFKENQVRDRLNSVGRDISILVQPMDLIKQMKKQMKNLRNYKDYILQ